MSTNDRKNSHSVRTRIGFGFALILVMMIVLTATGVIRVNAIAQSLSIINDVNSVKQRYAINFRGSVHDRAIVLRDVTLLQDDTELSFALSDMERLAGDYARAAQALDAVILESVTASDQEQSILAKIKSTEARALPVIAQTIALRKEGRMTEAQQLMLLQAKPIFSEWLSAINAFIDYQERLNGVEATNAREAAHGFEAFMLLLCGLAVAAGVGVAWVITRQIILALGAEPSQVRSLAEAVERGELFHQEGSAAGDQASIMATLRRMSGSLRNTVSGVREAAQEVAMASNEIAKGNQNLSSRTKQQARALDETAVAMRQLTSTVRQNADHARQANDLAASASSVALRGGAAVSEVVHTMETINDSAKRIVDIIGVIDSIAFQTNILALNAAVEAARAGDQGRGFAVVAAEVRSLAHRSATAAKEIKTLIGNSTGQIESGAALVNQAGATMQEIVGSVRRVTTIMVEILAASEEQTIRIEQANQAIGEMDRVTQENAALVEEAAAGAASLKDQAQRLAEAVRVFRLESVC